MLKVCVITPDGENISVSVKSEVEARGLKASYERQGCLVVVRPENQTIPDDFQQLLTGE